VLSLNVLEVGTAMITDVRISIVITNTGGPPTEVSEYG
jgi:hypothetical protein